ncbi:lysylphosphatidylglycerol synthase domain-containing protein [Zavarzinia sp. CC-PAN008]|uniref:lysylphosphatidylglycerol synthase domain-containing protein n=1 Tax=Zavarzinia sp. CC-PAN008 TaxID=3243332 RepID=UPI003F748797
MRWLSVVAGLAGLGLAGVLLVDLGIGQVLGVMGTLGIVGFLALVCYWPVTAGLCALAWRGSASAVWHGSPRTFFTARWVRDSINTLLPVAGIGGTLIGARLISQAGAGPATSLASSVVDMTIEALAQLAFTLLGLALLMSIADNDEITNWVLGGMVGSGLGLAVFVLLQRSRVMHKLEAELGALASRWNPAWGGSLAGLAAAMHAIWRNPGAVSRGGALHMLAWIAGAGELWIALQFMGVPLGFAECLVLEAVGQAVRSAAFAVPGGLGVQEGGFVVLGAMLGLPAEQALALSLLRRLRQVAVYLPGLVLWQVLEARRPLPPPTPLAAEPELPPATAVEVSR